MIANVLETLAKEVNQFFKLKYDLNEDVVVLSHLVSQDGSTPINAENKMVCSLLSIEQDRMNLNAAPSARVVKNPPIHLNAYLLFAANFNANNYVESLRVLSGLMAFFQGKQVFTPQNTPGLQNSLDKLTIEISNVELRDLSNLWGAIGAKQLPSILYKLRMISIDQERLLEELPAIEGLQSEVK